MQCAFIVLFATLAAVSATSYKSSYPAYNPKPTYYKDSYDYAAPAYYSFDYAVKDNNYNDFGHQESRNGDNTKGSYSVVLPDGRRQVVNYYVDDYSGYVADVKYEGYAKTYDNKPSYESYKPAYKPSYKPAYKSY